MKRFLSLMVLLSTGCTGQIPGSFRLAQQTENLAAATTINTKIDLLWVVGNSAGMDVVQRRLRDGFSSFANSYLKPYWDIRLAVVTTDMYLANSAYSNYLNTTISGTVNYHSASIASRIGTWVNPTWNTSLLNLGTANFTSGIKFGELVPVWGTQYSKLIAGYHDGPVPGLCAEWMPYFTLGESQCGHRDVAGVANGTAACLGASSTDSMKECVNTVENNTVRSGKPIISTQDYGNTNAMVQDFLVNASVGSVGQGSQRGFSSVLQMLNDNEASGSSSKFFRAGSLRGIIFVSFEEDQSMDLPSIIPAGFRPESNHACDQAGLVALNGSAAIIAGGVCCTAGQGTCTYGSAGITCPSKTVDGVTYTPSTCADSTKLTSLTSIKNQFDTFFRNLDGSGTGGDANYFSAAIVASTGASITALQTARDATDITVGQMKNHAVDRADRYIDFGTLVGNGSMTLDIGQTDYAPLLNQIGQNIVLKKGTFTLARVPTGSEDMIVTLKFAAGGSRTVASTEYTLSGKNLILSDAATVLSLKDGDQLSVNYQPKTVY